MTVIFDHRKLFGVEICSHRLFYPSHSFATSCESFRIHVISPKAKTFLAKVVDSMRCAVIVDLNLISELSSRVIFPSSPANSWLERLKDHQNQPGNTIPSPLKTSVLQLLPTPFQPWPFQIGTANLNETTTLKTDPEERDCLCEFRHQCRQSNQLNRDQANENTSIMTSEIPNTWILIIVRY